jgi:hypothetical protein
MVTFRHIIANTIQKLITAATTNCNNNLASLIKQNPSTQRLLQIRTNEMLLVNDLYCDRCSALHVSGSFARHQELILNYIATYFRCLTVFAIGTGRVCGWQFSLLVIIKLIYFTKCTVKRSKAYIHVYFKVRLNNFAHFVCICIVIISFHSYKRQALGIKFCGIRKVLSLTVLENRLT